MYQKGNEYLEILELFTSGYNKQFYLREISRLTKIPLKTTQSRMLNLENNKILKSEESGKNKYFKLNLNNIQTKFSLLRTEIYRTEKFMEKYAFFNSFLGEMSISATIIVFGSFASFKADKNSDLDLLIISNKIQQLPLHLMAPRVHKIEMSESAFLHSLEKQETLIKEIEENHIILNNHSFYINILWNYYGKQQA